MPERSETEETSLVKGVLAGRPVKRSLPEVFWVARYDYEPSWGFDPHCHDFYQLIYVVDGNGTVEIGHQSFDLIPPICLLWPPFVRHALRADHDVKLRTLDVKFDADCAELETSLREVSIPVPDSDGAVRGLLEELHHEAVMGGRWHRELCCTLLMYVLIIIARRVTGKQHGELTGVSFPNPADEGIKELLCFIHQNYADSELSLNQLAEQVGYSKSYLEKKFRMLMGVSIHRYVRRYRVYQAKELLRYSEYAIKEIAELTGFKSVHHFTRVFSEIEGTPPAKWRAFELRTGRKGVLLSPRFVNIDITKT